MPAHAVVETRRQDAPAGRQRIDSECLDNPSVGGRAGFWRRLARDVLGWKYEEVCGDVNPQ